MLNILESTARSTPIANTVPAAAAPSSSHGSRDRESMDQALGAGLRRI
jgi:hypothetical protein